LALAAGAYTVSLRGGSSLSCTSSWQRGSSEARSICGWNSSSLMFSFALMRVMRSL
jgi:hypothetical protein